MASEKNISIQDRSDFIGPIYLGSSGNQTGLMTFWNSGSYKMTNFQAGVATADTTYTYPTAGPVASDYFLRSSAAGVLSWGNSYPGTTTNDNAAGGYVGEYMVSSQPVPQNAYTSNTYGDAGSITLSPGDWDITLILNAIRSGATWTRNKTGIGTVSGNDSTGIIPGDNETDVDFGVAVPEGITSNIPCWRASIATQTTYYGKIRTSYTAGTPVYVYRLSARRIR